MKNEELKEQYLEENYLNVTTRKSKRSVFATLGEAEDALNKDFGDFTREDVMKMIKEYGGDNLKTFETKMSAVRKYVEWYRKVKKLEPTKAWKVSARDLVKHFDAVLSTASNSNDPLDREDILKASRRLKNPRDKAILLGLFEGICGAECKEFLEIRPEDVKEDSIYIRDRDKDFPASDTLLGYFKDAMKEKIYIAYRTVRQPKELLMEEDTVALKVPSTDAKPNASLPRSFGRMIDHELGVEKHYQINNIRLWGMANMLLDYAEKNDLPIDSAYLLYSPEILERFNRKKLDKQKVLSATERLKEYREKTNG